MTIDQFDKAIELRRQIHRLTDLLEEFKKVTIDDSPCRMTGFCIRREPNRDFYHVVENYELEFLIDSIESKINVLEHEFKKL